MKPILCLDFDGVIHSYTSGWKGADVIPDPPVPGAIQFMADVSTDFCVVVFSSRSNQPGGLRAMQNYIGALMDTMLPPELAYSVFSALEWPTEKPPAMITIDDRAITFTGEWPDIETLKSFKPWNKK